jgi:hypothetical protein
MEMLRSKKLSFLICGAEDYKGEQFATNVLEQLYIQTRGNVGQLHYTGVPGGVEQWATSHHITVKLYELAPLLKLKNTPDMIELPEFMKNENRYYLKGRTLLQRLKIDLVVAIPNKDGRLSASAWDTVQFAGFANVRSFDCTTLWEFVKSKLDTIN